MAHRPSRGPAAAGRALPAAEPQAEAPPWPPPATIPLGARPPPQSKGRGKPAATAAAKPALKAGRGGDALAWRAYASRVTPLAGRTPIAPPPAPEVIAPPAAPAAIAARRPKPAGPPPELHVGQQPPGLDMKRWRGLRRGRLRPERTLDLHGHFVQEAHGLVRGFLRRAHADGLRCVAVVTGKGSTPEGGVLRRELPHWLNAPDLRPLLLGAAHPHAANAGAVHLLLRRPGMASPGRR